LIGEDTRVLVQGITGNQGQFHAQAMLNYGTKVVAGVTPGKGGQRILDLPVFDRVSEAMSETGANTSIIFVPARAAAQAVNESIESGIRVVVVITEMIPQRDAVEFIARADKKGTIIVGPNTPGMIAPPLNTKVGIMSGHIFKPGSIGITSRSGTLTYEISWHISRVGLGQSVCLGIGGDAIVGLNFVRLLEMFRDHEETKAVVLVGEVGGKAEEVAAQYITETAYPKPVVAYIAGRSAPPEKRMGHAGAIVMGKVGTAQSKIEAFRAAGVPVADMIDDVPKLLMERL
jgi:succinyl-CoA synthetase alpha subunit